MNKTNLWLLIGLLLAGGLATFLVMRGKQNTSLKGSDYDFGIKDTTAIGKIFLVNRNGGTITLERKGPANWVLNGKYRARQSGIDNLLEVMWGLELKFRLPRKSIPNVVGEMGSIGTKVEVYDLAGKVMKVYYVGGVTAGEDATYMMMEGSNEPYCIYDPRRGSVRVSYFTNEDDWRDKTLLPFSADEYQSAGLYFLQQPQKSFKVNRKNGSFEVLPGLPGTPMPTTKVRPGSVETWLELLPRWVAVELQNKNPYKDSISHLVPFCVLAIELKSGATDTIRLFPNVSRDQFNNPIVNGKGEPIIETYYATNQRRDFWVMQDRLTKPVMLPLQFFF
jgi:hypothetical protein